MITPAPPVLLVPGWAATARHLRQCRRFLLESGWPDDSIECLTFRRRYGSNIEHAAELARAAEALGRRKRSRIAVVAHSMGGLALRRYLLDGGGDTVDTAIFVGTPHRGTWMAWLAWGGGGREMRPGSEFLRELNERPLPQEVRSFCLRTPIDTRVLPGDSAWLDGAECLTVRLPTHPRMLSHARTLGLIRELLLDTGRAAA